MGVSRRFFGLLGILPISRGCLPAILSCCSDCSTGSLTTGLSSVSNFGNVASPVVRADRK